LVCQDLTFQSKLGFKTEYMNEGKIMNGVHPSGMIASTIKRIYQSGLTTTSGGNISIMDENGDIWITPSAIDKGTLQPSDIICVKVTGIFWALINPLRNIPFTKAFIRPGRILKRSSMHTRRPWCRSAL
jgi:L-fuculose-phosphate aldolase